MMNPSLIIFGPCCFIAAFILNLILSAHGQTQQPSFVCGSGYYATSQYTCCPVGTKLINGLCYLPRNAQTDILSSGANATAILAQNGITSKSLLAAVIGSFFNTQSGKHLEVKYYTNGTRYFCAEPNSPIAVMLTHLIQVELLSIKQLMNQTEIDQLNHAIPKIQAIICPREG